MKRRNRITQHKESEKSEIKKNQELRVENQKLKRQVARLTRELEKRENLLPQVEEAELINEEKDKPKSPTCEECGSPSFKTLTLGPKTIIVCQNCKWRKST